MFFETPFFSSIADNVKLSTLNSHIVLARFYFSERYETHPESFKIFKIQFLKVFP